MEVKHSVKNLVLKSSSVDAEVAVPNAARQQDSSVETDEQDSEMYSLGYGEAQLIPFVRRGSMTTFVDSRWTWKMASYSQCHTS